MDRLFIFLVRFSFGFSWVEVSDFHLDLISGLISGFLALHNGLQVRFSGFGFATSGLGVQISGFAAPIYRCIKLRFRASGLEFHGFKARFRASGFEFRAFRASGFEFRAFRAHSFEKFFVRMRFKYDVLKIGVLKHPILPAQQAILPEPHAIFRAQHLVLILGRFYSRFGRFFRSACATCLRKVVSSTR